MRSSVAAVLAFVVLAVVVGGCSSPEAYSPPPAEDPALRTVDSGEARAVVDEFLAALTAGDMAAAGTLLTGRALEASRTLAGASSVTLLSVAEDTGIHDPDAKIFEVQCEVAYPQKAMAQSGVYIYRLRVMRTPEGLRIENLGP